MTIEQADTLQEVLDSPEVVIVERLEDGDYLTFEATVGAAYYRCKEIDGEGYKHVPVLVQIDLTPLERLSEKSMKAKMRARMEVE